MKLVLRVTPKQRIIITEQAIEQMLAHVQLRFWHCCHCRM